MVLRYTIKQKMMVLIAIFGVGLLVLIFSSRWALSNSIEASDQLALRNEQIGIIKDFLLTETETTLLGMDIIIDMKDGVDPKREAEMATLFGYMNENAQKLVELADTEGEKAEADKVKRGVEAFHKTVAVDLIRAVKNGAPSAVMDELDDRIDEEADAIAASLNLMKVSVEVTIATRPAIELGDYVALVPDFTKPAISDEAIMERINELATAQAPFVNVEEDRALVSGDTALIDFEGFVDGEAFEGGKAEGFSLRLGSGQFIPGFEDQAIGMKKGDEKTIDVTFPENYGGAKLAGKPAQFKVTVHAIQQKEAVSIDDELAKKMLPGSEDATLDLLKEKVKEQLESEEMSKLYNEELKPAIMEKFVTSFTFDLPTFIVEQEIDMALNKKARDMEAEELEALRNDEAKIKELRETFREDASRAVKATFIVDALAKAENINVSEQELMQTIYFEAMQMGQDPAGVYKQYQESGYLPAIQMAMVEDRVLSKLLNDKIKEA